MKPIVQVGDPVLRKKAVPVKDTEFGTSALSTLIRNMTEAVDKEPDGVALAAPQIGVAKRIFIVRYDRMTPPPSSDENPRKADIGVYINPEITKTSRKRAPMDEGCLSVRGKYGTTTRFSRLTVRAKDERGKVFERGAGSVLAQAFQHEIDHLNGVLFTDHALNVYEARPIKHA